MLGFGWSMNPTLPGAAPPAWTGTWPSGAKTGVKLASVSAWGLQDLKYTNHIPSLKLTACPGKLMVERLLSFWGLAYFQGRTVSFRECNKSSCPNTFLKTDTIQKTRIGWFAWKYFTIIWLNSYSKKNSIVYLGWVIFVEVGGSCRRVEYFLDIKQSFMELLIKKSGGTKVVIGYLW